ncbi:zinc finger protein 75A-like isoform X2 [Pleurodeles waltl]|uniref:zinc finger protein 75A-like isoform X2 n=1 Tax=Pleurodeles waltl TaxID=8319 RepID=UPI00370959BB
MPRRQSAEEAQVSYQEASSCFSEDEWKLLHEWQKELYRNVMKEIHQALISLGPLIATTVFSLRAKEKEELCPLDDQEAEIKNHINLPRIFPFLNTDVCLRKEEEMGPIFIDHLGIEMKENSTDPNVGQEFVSFHIKDEEETYCIDSLDRRRIESSATGDGSINRQKISGESKQCTRNITTPYKTSSEKNNCRMFHSSLRVTNSRSQQRSERYQEMSRRKPIQTEHAFSNAEHYGLQQGHPRVKVSKKYNEFEDNLRTSSFFNGLPDAQQNPAPCTGDQFEKSYILQRDFIRQTGMRSAVRPYACTVCDKSFFRKGHLITHYRTHTGEKPYPCPFCPKRFNRKDNLNGHIRIHTGEKPYTCVECEKNFTSKSDLNQHRKRRH